MPTDEERREVAQRLRELCLNPWDDAACEIAQCVGIACCNSECHGSDETPECTMAFCALLADLMEPPYPDATASYKGWRAEVYDPDGVLASPSNAAADLVRAHADGKMRHSTKEEQNAYSAMLEKMSVEMHPVDRDALLALADEMDERAPYGWYSGERDSLRDYARRIREALGVER